MLKEVKLLKHDTCYTYMLKRLGKYDLDSSMIESTDYIKDYKKYVAKMWELSKGDVLLIEDEDKSSVTTRRGGIITEDCRVYQESITWGLHFMVYEGCFDGVHTVSDCVWITDNGQEILSIRLKDLSLIVKSWVKLIKNGL